MDTIERAIRKLGTSKGRFAATVPKVKGEASRDHTGGFPRPSQTNQYQSIDKGETDRHRQRRVAVIKQGLVRSAGIVNPDGTRSRIREEFRRIKRPLLVNAAGKGMSDGDHGNMIMVTSAREGEGKTFTALNLALSMASERDRTVLLVDADVVNPRIHTYFELQEGPGLVDFLVEDGLDIPDVLIETDVPKLSLIPAGSRHHLSTEILASDSMRAVADEMSRRYSDRVIIFDSPPLLVTSEASVLATLVGQIVIVIEAEKTLQSEVENALALLKDSTTTGIVLNKTNSKNRSMLFGGKNAYGHEEQ